MDPHRPRDDPYRTPGRIRSPTAEGAAASPPARGSPLRTPGAAGPDELSRTPAALSRLRSMMSPPLTRLPDASVPTPEHFRGARPDTPPAPAVLSDEERAAIALQAQAEGGRASDTEAVLLRELRVLQLEGDAVREEIRQWEEERLALELQLSRLERVIPTRAAFLQGAREREAAVRAALDDPEAALGDTALAVRAATPGDAKGLLHEIGAAQSEAQRLAEQNSDLEQEALMRSLNACHALEMLTTSLKFQQKWCDDSAAAAARLQLRCDDAQRAALEAAREEEAALRDLHEVSAGLAQRKRGLQLVHRRLLGADTLPNGQYITDSAAQALLLAVRDEVSRGSMRLLRELERSTDFNVAALLVGAGCDAQLRSASPPRRHAQPLPGGGPPSAAVSWPEGRSSLSPPPLPAAAPLPYPPPPPREPRGCLSPRVSTDSAGGISMLSTAGGAQWSIGSRPPGPHAERSPSEVLQLHERAQHQLRGVAATLASLGQRPDALPSG